MTSWKEYIENKFQPRNEFLFSNNDLPEMLTITHNSSQTYFTFLFMFDDWNRVIDIQFHNIKTQGWSGEFQGDFTYDKDTSQRVDNFLSPAFETGWTSKDIFLFGKHFKSVVYWNLTQTGSTFKSYSSDLGCLSLILFPFFELLCLLIGEVKIVKIEPINNTVV